MWKWRYYNKQMLFFLVCLWLSTLPTPLHAFDKHVLRRYIYILKEIIERQCRLSFPSIAADFSYKHYNFSQQSCCDLLPFLTYTAWLQTYRKKDNSTIPFGTQEI
jgi:hypothetical protein